MTASSAVHDRQAVAGRHRQAATVGRPARGPRGANGGSLDDAKMGRSPVPSGRTAHSPTRWPLTSWPRKKAIQRPSGDHAGQLSTVERVTRRSRPDATSTFQIDWVLEPPFEKATCRPSGDQAGSTWM